MPYSIVNLHVVHRARDFRLDAEYWHPELIANSSLVENERAIANFVDTNIENIKKTPIERDFDYLEISNISLNGTGYNTTKVRQGEEPDRAHHVLKKRDIVISTVRVNRNAVAMIEDECIIGSSGLSVLRPQDIEPEYLFAFCKTGYFVNCLVRASRASMYPAVSSRDVLDVPLFVPSKLVRGTVVKLIGKSLSLLSQARQIYAHAQSVLLSEFGLTNWQPRRRLTFVKNHSDTERAGRIDAEYYQPHYEEVVHAIQNYPGGWDTLGNLVSLKKCVEVGKDKYRDEGVPFVRVSDLNTHEITRGKCISEELYQKVQQHQPNKGEILFSKDATPGIAYYLNESPGKMIPSSGILRLASESDKINGECLTLVLNSVLTREQIKRDVGGSVILHWRPDQVARTAIPVFPDEKQAQIQQKVAEEFSLRRQARRLLECARRTVEIAIEQDERTALDWLRSATGESPNDI